MHESPVKHATEAACTVLESLSVTCMCIEVDADPQLLPNNHDRLPP